jgi:hypothetical protein
MRGDSASERLGCAAIRWATAEPWRTAIPLPIGKHEIGGAR